MMGNDHAGTGAALGLAVAEFINAVAPRTISIPEALFGAAVCAGAALLPDWDHPKARISKSFGPFTRGFGILVRAAAGGHRHGTHSHTGVGVFNLVAFGAVALYSANPWMVLIGLVSSFVIVSIGWTVGHCDRRNPHYGLARAYKTPLRAMIGIYLSLTLAAGMLTLAVAYGRVAGAVMLGALLVLTLSAGIQIFNIKGKLDDYLPIPVVAWLLWKGFDMSFVPYAVTLGVYAHIAGDLITVEGCPLGWPWSRRMNHKWSWGFHAGGPFEKHVIAPVIAVVVALLAANELGVFAYFIHHH